MVIRTFYVVPNERASKNAEHNNLNNKENEKAHLNTHKAKNLSKIKKNHGSVKNHGPVKNHQNKEAHHPHQKTDSSDHSEHEEHHECRSHQSVEEAHENHSNENKLSHTVLMRKIMNHEKEHHEGISNRNLKEVHENHHKNNSKHSSASLKGKKHRNLQEEHVGESVVNENVDSSVKQTKVLSSKKSHQAAIDASASSFSKGKGQSMAMAGPKGSNSMAKGELGSGSSSNFSNLSSSIEDTFGLMMDSNGNSKQFGQKSSENKNVKGSSKGISHGQGSSKSASNFEGSMGFGEGELGSSSGSTFGNNSDLFVDKWDVSQNSKGEYKKTRNTSSKKDASLTNAQGESKGKGSAMTKADNNGGMVKAEGEKGSRASSNHIGASDSWGMSFDDSFTGGKKSVKNDEWTEKENSKGSTFNEALGNGSVMGMSHRFDGSQGIAQGSEGTTNEATWTGNSDKKRNSFISDFDW